MNLKLKPIFLALACAFAATAVMPSMALAADDAASLKAELDALKKEFQELRLQMKGQTDGAASKADIATLKEQVTEAREASIRPPFLWDKNSSFHFGGYSAVGVSSQRTGNRSFDQAVFVPGFHFNYQDIAFAEAKFETAVAPSGETETKLESANLNLFLGDHAVLTVGKFLSPLGQFQQNYHAPWINKLASRPAGFGEEASGAPLANLGAQVRGGFGVGPGMKMNYAAFLANAPRLVVEDGEIEMITNDTGTQSPNNKKIYGGRVSFFPMPSLEFGASAATGKTAVQEFEGERGFAGVSRSYRATGVDFAWQFAKKFDLRGEYLRQRIGAGTETAEEFAAIPSDGGLWSAGYVQAAYKFMPKWEGVYRYSKFNSPHGSQRQKQNALGVNYWYASNVVAKATYEFNDGVVGQLNDRNRLLLQLTYGF